MAPKRPTKKQKINHANSSPSSIKVRGTTALINIIRQKLHVCAFMKDSPNQKFITRHSLRDIWTFDLLAKFFDDHSVDLGALGVETVREKLLKTLSILVLIQWPNWTRFASIFLHHTDEEGKNDRLDDYLPHSNQKISAIFGPLDCSEFIARQYEICPITIREGEHCVFSEDERLPFINLNEKIIGVGGYGDVFEEVIAPGQYISKDDMINVGSMVIARKVLAKSFDFDVETRNLKMFREGLASHKLIATYKAFLTVGKESSILYDRADMDLEQFLHRDDLGFEISATSILRGATNLADALSFLHGGLKLEGTSEPLVCCHRDLTPRNILVFRNPRASDQFTWKISDLGISSIQKDPHQNRVRSNSAQLTPRDITENLTMKTTAQRGGGAYLAPEALRDSGVVGRRSDVWSFGCILTRILAREKGGRLKMVELDELRDKCEDKVTLYKNDYFYREETIINPHIRAWLDNLSDLSGNETAERFYTECRKVILGMLEEKKDKRPRAKMVYHQLLKIRGLLPTMSYTQTTHDRAETLPASSRNLVAEETEIPSLELQSIAATDLRLLAENYPLESHRIVSKRTYLTSADVNNRLQTYLTSNVSQVFWIQESVAGRDTPFWPITQCIISAARDIGTPVIIHLCQYKASGSTSNGPLAMVYSIIYQLIRILSSHFTQPIQIRRESVVSLSYQDECFPLAIQILGDLLSQCTQQYLLVIDDFESLLREDPERSHAILEALHTLPAETSTPVKSIITTSGFCKSLAARVPQDSRIKIMANPDKDKEELETTLRGTIAYLSVSGYSPPRRQTSGVSLGHSLVNAC